jgi:hypothetical protein
VVDYQKKKEYVGLQVKPEPAKEKAIGVTGTMIQKFKGWLCREDILLILIVCGAALGLIWALSGEDLRVMHP